MRHLQASVTGAELKSEGHPRSRILDVLWGNTACAIGRVLGISQEAPVETKEVLTMTPFMYARISRY